MMSDFIEWHGGECPVGENETVEYKLRSTIDIINESRAGSLEWRREHDYPMRDWDIVAYRLKQKGDKHENSN